MLDHIVSLAAAIAGPSDAERPLLEALCASAEDQLKRRLRPGVAPEDCGDALPCAAALLAAAGLLPCRSAGEPEQFTAGDVSVRTDGGRLCRTAAALRRQAAGMMVPFCEAGDFAFRGVRG